MRTPTSFLTILIGTCCLIVAACCDLEITTQQLPDARVGSPYSEKMDADCDNENWELVSGDLPPGIGFSSEGKFSGVPTDRGTYSVTVGVAGDSDEFVSKGFTIRVRGVSSCAVSVSSVDFDTISVASSRDTVVTITNSGEEPLKGTVSISTDIPCVDFSVPVGLGAYNLLAGEIHSITVTFAPTTAGPKACRIETGNSLCPDIGLSGTGE